MLTPSQQHIYLASVLGFINEVSNVATFYAGHYADGDGLSLRCISFPMDEVSPAYIVASITWENVHVDIERMGIGHLVYGDDDVGC